MGLFGDSKSDLKSEIEKKDKNLKIWKIVGIGGAVAFAGALIWAITK